MSLRTSIAAGCLAIGGVLAAARADAQTCTAARDVPAAARAAAELEQAPDRLDSRLALAAVLMERGCYADVVSVGEAGRELHPRSAELQLLVRDARSMLAEQVYFDGLEEAEAAARVRRNVLRCNQLADVAACDAALVAKPGDGEILVAKGDALVAGGKLGDALGVYRHALEVVANDAPVQAKIDATDAQRAAATAACFDAAGGPDALRGCELALLPGSPDEFEVRKRRGLLYQQGGDNARALDAYLSAAELEPNDRATAAAVVALVDSTGRADYLALVARGVALTALDRPADAIRALRRAQALAPDVDAAKAPLAAAEARRRSASATCLGGAAAPALAACRAALLQGSSDELEVLFRTVALLGDGGDVAAARPLLERAAALRPNDSRVEAELARLAARDARVAQADAGATRSQGEAVSVGRRYSNSESRGQAH